MTEHIEPGLDDLLKNAEAAARLLKVISNPHRLLMLCTIMQTPGVVNGELAEKCGLSISAASQHLTIMCKENVIFKVKKSQKTSYHIKEPATKEIIMLLKKAFPA